MQNKTFKGNPYAVLLYRLGVILIILSLSRICLYFFNTGYFNELTPKELFTIYILGFRFDIAALMMLNAPLILFSTQPFRFKHKAKLNSIVLYITLVFNGIAILFNLIDITYFRFTLRRSSYDLFLFLDTNVGLFDIFKALILDYWYLILMAAFFIYSMVYATLKIKEKNDNTKQSIFQLIYKSLIFLFAIGISILGIRGGTQLKPLNLIDAGKMVSSNEVPLVLNTPFSILVTIGKQKLETKTWFTQEESEKRYNTIHQYHKKAEKSTKKNVVVLILESFSTNKIGYFNSSQVSLTPFLDSLLAKSLTFDGISNGKKSIEGIPAILSSIPSLMRQPFLTSPYSTNQFSSLAELLKKEGYYSAFFHGGKNGTMNFDSYAANAGFESYFGLNEYHNLSDYDGSWGIWDHQFYPFFKAQLDQFKEPFIAAFFSLSSHHPYSIPQDYKTLFSASENPLDNCISYSDFALSQFFESAQKEDWYTHTLFVLSADHTAELPNTADSSNLIHFEIPIAFFAPNDSVLLKSSHRKTIQQIDIMPSVLDYLNYNKPFFAFGNSVFDMAAPDFALYYLNEVYHGITSDAIIEFDGETFRSKSRANSTQNMNNKKLQLVEDQMKAFIQIYTDRMNTNKIK
ncbi:MAG: sulfatase-like hydrolase/transferase [Bacteroidales bacterium]|nr:sulfatase-like hydrolase/transferase [Bacteroidales bacterium]